MSDEEDWPQEQETAGRSRIPQTDTERDASEDITEWFGMRVHTVVFPLSMLCILGFIAVTVGLGDRATLAYTAVFEYTNANFGWFYVLAVNVCLAALLGIGFSRYGTIRLGGPDAEPEFSTLAWLSMLFSSGMGVGLLFFGVAEPTYHFLSGGGSFFDVSAGTPAAGRAATALTMFHWGFHPWGIYGIVGLGLAFFAFNRGLPLSFRSIFYPMLGSRIYGWPGHLVDLAAVVATVFGLATATGLAALQINAGLDFVATGYFATELSTDMWTSIAIIILIIGITAVSTWAGLDAGIKRLSKVNVGLMVSLLAFVAIAGPTVYLLDVFNSGLSAYLGNFVELSFYAEAFAGEDAGWQHSYTIFYWGFWIVWSPFVGMFIARISRGRTVREFVISVLLVPALFSLVWMAVFNGSALFVELQVQNGGISDPLQTQGQAVALFQLLSFYPVTFLASVVTIANLVTFIATSTDSGALVTSYITAGGRRDTDTNQRVIWPLLTGGTACVLLIGDGLQALQTAVIATGLPFGVIIVFMVYALYRGLDREFDRHRVETERRRQTDETSERESPSPVQRDE